MIGEKWYNEIPGCLFCSSKELKTAIDFGRFPFSPGVKERPDTEHLYPFVFVLCQRCGLLQQKYLVSPHMLYPAKLVDQGVGAKWGRHYDSLAHFIQKSILRDQKHMLDIGAAHDLVEKKLEELESGFHFTLCDPNPKDVGERPTLRVEKKFFNEYETDEKFDIILLSHMFEHIGDHILFIGKCKSMLSEGGKIIISIPNFEIWIREGFLNAFVQEHTVYPPKDVVISFFNSLGMKADRVELFEDHSVFFTFSVSSDAIPEKIAGELALIIKKQEKDIDAYRTMLEELGIRYKAALQGRDYYMYGAHIFTQIFLFYCGLDKERVLGALDNSKSKRGKFLCGTNIKTFAPEEIRGKKNPVVVLNAGAYTDEIRKQLLEINPDVSIIE